MPDARPIRVLHVFGVMNRGGAEMRTVEVLHESDRGRVALEFCVLSGLTGTLDDEIREQGSMVHRCRLDATFVPRFVALLRRRKIDVVHSHVHLATGFTLAVARLAGVRSRIAHFRSTGDERGGSMARRGYRTLMRQLLDRNATQILGVAAGVLDRAWSPAWRDDPRCRVVYNGIDSARFFDATARSSLRAELGVAGTAPVIVQVARFDVLKNQPFAVDVLAQVPGAQLVFVGRSGVGLEETRRRALQHGVGARVHFVGERTDVPRYLCGADLSILTSTHEGLPGAVLESLAAGTPVVASDLPGVREIAAAVGGVRVHGFDVARWASSVRELLAARRDPTLRARFATSPFSLLAATAALTEAWERR